MSRKLYNSLSHLRSGAFGKPEQHFENRFNDIIEEIRLRAWGYMTPVSTFTTRKSGIVDTEMIKTTVAEILDLKEELHDGFKDKSEKDFYSSFFYCALAICSVDFQYFEVDYDNQIQVESLSDHTKGSADFLFLTENADTESDENGTGLEAGIYSRFIPMLYELLTGRQLELKTVYHDIMDDLSQAELREIHEDFEETDISPEDLAGEAAEIDDSDEQYDISDEEAEEEAREANRLSGGKVKLSYLGYADYIANAELFSKLLDNCISDRFFSDVKDMVSDFLAHKGLTVFNNEKAYIELMVSLNRARKTAENSAGLRGGNR